MFPGEDALAAAVRVGDPDIVRCMSYFLLWYSLRTE